MQIGSIHKVGSAEKEDKIEFKVRAYFPVLWRKKSIHLKATSEVIYKSIEDFRAAQTTYNSYNEEGSKFLNYPNCFDEHSAVYFFLIGTCLENLFKPIIILDNPQYVNGKLGKKLLTHDLEKLAKSAKVSLSHRELELCKVCTSIVITYSKYPVPGDARDLTFFMHFNASEAKDVFESFFARLEHMLLSKEKDLIPNPNERLQEILRGEFLA